MDADATPPPRTLAPLIAYLEACRVQYAGRARATQTGGSLVVLVKADGTVLLHHPTAGVKPHFYNTPGRTRIRRRGNRLHIHAVSKTGEVLRMSGLIRFLQPLTTEGRGESAVRRRVEGVERDLIAWVLANPRGLGLPRGQPVREERRTGGRIDLRFGDVIVEAKSNGNVPAYDQAQRYLRDPSVRRVVLVCARASQPLRELCRLDDRVDLVETGEPPKG